MIIFKWHEHGFVLGMDFTSKKAEREQTLFNMVKHFAKTIKGKETKCSANNCGVEVH